MKKNLFLFICATGILLGSAVGTVFAQKQTKKDSGKEVVENKKDAIDIEGIWQLDNTALDGSTMSQNLPPIFKVLSGDGKFTNFILTEEGAKITAKGNYRVVTESSRIFYIETIIESSFMKNHFKNNENKIIVNDLSEDYLSFQFTNPRTQINVTEKWKRVTLLKTSN